MSLLDVRPEDRVLEIGFGPGIAIRELGRLARKGYVCGIDHSELMLRLAKRFNAEALRRGVVDLRLGSVLEDLPAFDEPFDKILAVNATMFWREPVAPLEDLRRLLWSGGLIAVAHQPRGPGASDETGSLGSGDGGGSGPGRLLRGAARDHGPEARGGLRAGREPEGRLMAEPGPRRASGPLVRVLGRRDLRVLWTSGTLSKAQRNSLPRTPPHSEVIRWWTGPSPVGRRCLSQLPSRDAPWGRRRREKTEDYKGI